MSRESDPAPTAAGPPRSFAALRHRDARIYLAASGLVMMADSIEHVISYWVIFEKFESRSLAGFAVISHWVPFLLFSVWAGALADRFDPRRIIQLGMGLFIVASVAWAVLIFTDSLAMWHAGVILVVHGMAGVFWGPAGQILLHEIVGGGELHSAIRLLAASRTLGLLFGPALGSALMFTIGPVAGLLVNALIYLPLVLWLWKAPYGPAHRTGPRPPASAIKGLADIVATVRAIAGDRLVAPMILLAGAASFFVGNAFQAQMPEFARDLATGNAGFYYGALLSANAAGAIVAGLVLEARNLLPPSPRTAFVLVGLWCLCLAGFAGSTSFPTALGFLLAAGFLNLAYTAMAQTLVQVHAPESIRGRVIGLYNMSALGLMAFSGVTIGFGGSVVGIHWSLGLSAAVLLAVTAALAGLTGMRSAGPPRIG